MRENQELIWVDKEFAERLKILQSQQSTREEQSAVFNDYLATITDQVRRDFKANLESLEEDAAIFTGLMLKVKQSFGKAKDEQLSASYALWEKFEAEIPSVQKKTEAIIAVLKPLKSELVAINELLGSISTHNIDRLKESIDAFANSYGINKKMVEFLVMNFKE